MNDEHIKAVIKFTDFVLADNSDNTYQFYALKLGILEPDLDTDWDIKRSKWFERLVDDCK